MTNVQTEAAAPRRILRLPDVLARIGMGRSWFLAEAAAGRAPKPLKIGSASGWDSVAIDAYVEQLITGGACNRHWSSDNTFNERRGAMAPRVRHVRGAEG